MCVFGRVPYLNGGLFAQDDDDQVGLIYLDDEIFDPKSDEGVLFFLNNHNFTVSEDTPLEVEVALDPEMLGKVFENLLAVEERGQSGTFYTPRPVVAFMCRQALAAYLSKATGITTTTLAALLDEAETGEVAMDAQGHPQLTEHTIPRSQRDAVERALIQVRVLDPAVGSGAFPLGMLALLVGVRRALYRIAGAALNPQSALVEGWKRNFIRDSLYGVDIKREAIEIARLRLWLSLVVDADPYNMEPLPNLDYKLMDGDSLIETFQGVEIFPTREPQQEHQVTLPQMDPNVAIIGQLRELQAQYFMPDTPELRRSLRAQIRATELTLVDRILDQRDAELTAKLNEVLRKLALLRSNPETAQLTREREELTRALAVHQSVKQAFRQGQSLPFFLYRLYFGSVFSEHDGFDIVIANPPYVRHERIAPETQATLKAAYPAVQHGMADLYTYFYGRALQLLRPNGTLAFITSNKFFRAGYGKGLLKTLTTQTTARAVIDFGDAPVFDAAAYPCIVITDNAPPPANHTYPGFTTPVDYRYSDLDKLGVTFADEHQDVEQSRGVRPPATSGATSALVEKLLSLGTPLGQFVDGKIYRGVLTGLNEAFVINQVTHDRLVAEDPKSAEILKPFLRGRDVGRYTIPIQNMANYFRVRWTDSQRYPDNL